MPPYTSGENDASEVQSDAPRANTAIPGHLSPVHYFVKVEAIERYHAGLRGAVQPSCNTNASCPMMAYSPTPSGVCSPVCPSPSPPMMSPMMPAYGTFDQPAMLNHVGSLSMAMAKPVATTPPVIYRPQPVSQYQSYTSNGTTYFTPTVSPDHIHLQTETVCGSAQCTNGIPSLASVHQMPRECYSPLGSSVCSSPGPLDTSWTSTMSPFFGVSRTMEVVWHGQFANHFNEFRKTYGHQWRLTPSICCEKNPTPSEGYKLFQDSAKVRFLCRDCGRGWTSMKGRVQFWFRLTPYNQGEVVFQLFGQQCSNCEEGFEHSMWYPEEVCKVVENVFLRVAQEVYGCPAGSDRAQGEANTLIRIDRRQGRPSRNHDHERCQACKMGLCSKEWIM